MRIHAIAFALFVAGFGYLLMAGGCTEESPTSDVDATAPTVSIRQPLEASSYGARIEDSVVVVVQAVDDRRIAKVQIWALFHDSASVATQIGPTLTEPDSAGFYSFHWSISGIDNGTTGVIYAVAVDEAGNSASSEKVRVQILNQSQAGPPIARFTVTPSEGTVANVFSFDPRPTRDVEEDIDIVVRWDFQNDGVWDVDTNSVTSTAAHVITRSFVTPDTYRVVMEAFNQYYSIPNNKPGRYVRDVIVNPAEGRPHPRPDEYFVDIPAGSYPLGALACETCGPLDEDERLDDTLFVRISNPYRISQYEVSNLFYKDFLNEAQIQGLVYFDFASLEVRSTQGDVVYAVLDQSLTRLKYVVADSTFAVDLFYERHPVTGVTYYGATAYANYYGTRLPTEAEWEIAARGNVIAVGHSYPWDLHQVIDGNYANFRDSGDPLEDGGVQGSTTPVGSYDGNAIGSFPTLPAPSLFGTYDQAGNVAEWVKDWYADSTYHDLLEEYVRTGSEPFDPQGPSVGSDRCVRGGSYTSWPYELRVTNRMSTSPDDRASWIGFRIAYVVF